jgi:hypothetical protein
MGGTIGIYCGASDDLALRKFGESIGLITISPRFDRELSEDAASGPYCFFSTVSKLELHPYGDPPVTITDVKDPIMRFMRSYFKDPYLVAGHIHWSDDVRALSVKTRPHYQQISKWINKNWERLPGGRYYVGPEARSLINRGAEMVNVLPGTADFKIIEV